MLKAIPFVIKLHACKNVDPRVNRVTHFCQTNARPQKTTYTQVAEREPCKRPDPCPPPPKDDKAFWGALAVLVTAGCFGVYAKHKPEIRDWLSIHAPWYDDLIAIAYEENKTYEEHAKDFIDAIMGYMDRKETPKLCNTDGTPIKQSPKEKKEGVDLVCSKKVEGGKKPVEHGKPPPPSLKTICEIEKCLRNHGEDCINNFWTAKEACRYYNELVEDNLNNFTYERLKQLRPAMLERFRLLNEHACMAAQELNTLEELARMLECGVSAPKETIDNTNAMMKEYMAKIKAMQMQYVWEADKAASLDSKWQCVEKLIDRYTQENEIIFPGTKYDSEKPSIVNGQDLLLIHTLRYKNWLETILKAGVEASSERANRGIETLSQDPKDVKARDNLIQSEYRKKLGELDLWYKKKIDWQKSDVDKQLQKALKEMKERKEKNMAIKLKETEEEATKKLDKKVKEAVQEQKDKFTRELRDISLKVKAVEGKLEARLKAEREAKRSQQLWTAGASLLAKTKRGDPRICVAREIKAIEAAAGDGDKLVQTVLKSIPEHVRKEGLVPESVLRERYHQMERTARSVALVEMEGSPMPVYIFSWVQSLFLFMKLSGIPQKDIDKPLMDPKELQDLDTFDRLNYARYWLEQGNLAPALRYVDSLQGASRVAADPWYKDAKSHLELRQAAEAVIAHATAMALQYV